MKKIFLIIGLVSLTVACGGGGDDSPPPPVDPDPPVVVNPPAAANLTFPANGEVCAIAKNLTGNDGDTDRTYTIEFAWTGDATTSTNVKYTLTLTNTDNNTSADFEVTASSSNVTLDVTGIIPGGDYSWQVVASKDGTSETTASATQTFTAAGVAEVSFAPNTATPVNPSRNQVLASSTTSVTLEWTGSDQNNDIKEYDVYFGEANPPTDMVTVDKDVTTRAVNTTANTIYYWRVITRDDVGNTSSSAIFQFTVAP